MLFKDHFSEVADRYARFRPRYPAGLFAYLAELAPGRGRAWDCGTGSGQAAVALARHFERVIASDASSKQVVERLRHDRVGYAVCLAEAVPLTAGSIDLVTVAQAVHWFELTDFYGEAGRVLRPGGVISVWTYNLPAITAEVDPVVERFYSEVVGAYWPAERGAVETSYRSIAFPFAEVTPPSFSMEADWRLDDFIGFLGTWSASRAYRIERGSDPVEAVRGELVAAWGDPRAPRRVRWPLAMRVGHAD